MYRCSVCSLVTPPRVPCYKLIKKTRTKDYPYRPKANPGYVKEDGKTYKSGKNRDKASDNGGTGWEIAVEVNCCPSCLAKIEGREEVKREKVNLPPKTQPPKTQNSNRDRRNTRRFNS